MTVENPTAAPIEEPVSDPIAGAGVVAALFAVVFELIASAGAEKLGSVQCVDNNDALIHWDSLDDGVRMAVTATHLYRNPVDGGVASSAPDSEAEGVRLSANLANASACVGWSRTNFSVAIRTWISAQGAAQRILWEQWTSGPKVTYNSGGVDTMVFLFPGDPAPSLTLTTIPEDQMVTVFLGFDFDNLTVHAAVYDEDGVTLIDSDSAVVTSLASTGDRLQLKSSAFHAKRAVAVNEWLPVGDKRTVLLEIMLTDDPVPVA